MTFLMLFFFKIIWLLSIFCGFIQIIEFSYFYELCQWNFDKNCIEFVDELENLKIPYSLLDAATMEDEDNSIVHKKLAQEFVERVKIIRGDYFYPSTNDRYIFK